jgi:hypothetical protein
MVTVRFDTAHATGLGRPQVDSFWKERYQFQNQTGMLTYLGGNYEPRLEVFRKPHIAVR